MAKKSASKNVVQPPPQKEEKHGPVRARSTIPVDLLVNGGSLPPSRRPPGYGLGPREPCEP